MRCGASLGVVMAVLGSAAESRATILLFDQARDATTQTIVEPTTAGAAAQQDYGDRVSGSPMDVPGGQFTYGNGGEGFTPNVVVDYFTDTDARLWTDQYGDLTNVLFARAPIAGGGAPGSLNVRLTADPGFAVELYHFDLAGWPTTDYTIQSVSVLSLTSTLFSQSDVLVEGNASGPGHTAFDFATPLSADQLLIQIDFSNLPVGSQDNIGMDNIRFGQNPPPSAVAAPGGLLFLCSGLLTLMGLGNGRRRPQRSSGSR